MDKLSPWLGRYQNSSGRREEFKLRISEIDLLTIHKKKYS